MRHLILTVLLGFFLLANSGGQTGFNDAPYILENLFDRLVDNHNDIEKLRINDSIMMIIDGYAGSDTVFTHRFDNLRYLGQVTSPDSLLKLISWNLILDNEPARYYSYFIWKADSLNNNKIHRLSAGYSPKKISTDTTYTQSDWYGALYYDLRPCIVDGKRIWVLLGIDYGNPEISRKVIEAVSFAPDGSIVFGWKFFRTGEDTKYRAVFEYASDAMMSLRFRSPDSIIFDHLVPFSPSQMNDRKYYGPDYSFDAYNFENGMWKLYINVDEFSEK